MDFMDVGPLLGGGGWGIENASKAMVLSYRKKGSRKKNGVENGQNDYDYPKLGGAINGSPGIFHGSCPMTNEECFRTPEASKSQGSNQVVLW